MSNPGLSEGVDKNCVSSNDTTEEEEGLEKLDSNQIIITSFNCIVENTVEKMFDQKKNISITEIIPPLDHHHDLLNNSVNTSKSINSSVSWLLFSQSKDLRYRMIHPGLATTCFLKYYLHMTESRVS